MWQIYGLATYLAEFYLAELGYVFGRVLCGRVRVLFSSVLCGYQLCNYCSMMTGYITCG